MTVPLIALALLIQSNGWSSVDLQSALAVLPEGGAVMVDVAADWCAPCHQLDSEVLDTPAGKQLLAQATGVRVDFDSAAGQALKRRYGVMVVPTTLVLDKGGVELGRVEGYPGRQEYLQAVNDALAGRVGLEALARRAKAAPKDLQAQLAWARARLVRGDRVGAKAQLKRLMGAGGRVAAEASRILGRWLLRVEEDGGAALTHFVEATDAAIGTPYWAGLLYWTAKARHHLGDTSGALLHFDDWRADAPGDPRALGYKANFMVENKYPAKATMAAIQEAVAVAPKDAHLHYLAARMHQQAGRLDAARAAIDVAIKLEPASAMCRNFKKRLARRTH